MRPSRAHVGADHHVAPRQFGPGGKYTTRPVDMYGREPFNAHSAQGVEAVHTASGRRIGYLSWHEPAARGDGTFIPHVQGSPDPSRSAIHKVTVSTSMQRKGMATAMLAHARDLRPGLQHSGAQALTHLGRQWAGARP